MNKEQIERLKNKWDENAYCNICHAKGAFALGPDPNEPDYIVQYCKSCMGFVESISDIEINQERPNLGLFNKNQIKQFLPKIQSNWRPDPKNGR